MRPGLQRFGTCFGNGIADQHYFTWDVESARYLTTKRECLDREPRRFAVCDETGTRELLHHVGTWMHQRFRQEQREQRRAVVNVAFPSSRTSLSQLTTFYRELGLQLTEDFVILRQQSRDSIILHHVCFPSSWRPERSLGADFRAIHAPVPAFQGVMARADSWVQALVSRGPYVRFVWSVVPENSLDLHPDVARGGWSSPPQQAFLRVERQVSVPFSTLQSCLFLMRVYVYPLESLDRRQLETLAAALRQMPDPIRRYKGIQHCWPELVALIEQHLR